MKKSLPNKTRKRTLAGGFVFTAFLAGALCSQGSEPMDTPPRLWVEPAAAEPGETGTGDPSSVTVSGQLFISHMPPPSDAVTQGVLHAGNHRFYLYRYPTRGEQWKQRWGRSLRDKTTQAAGSLPTVFRSSRGGRDITSGQRPNRFSVHLSPSHPVFWGVILLLVLFVAGLAWIHEPPAPITPPVRKGLAALQKKSPFHREFPVPTAPPHPHFPSRDAWTHRSSSPDIRPGPSLPSRSFSGSIQSIPMDSILQILSLENSTGILVISNEKSKPVGSFHFCKGNISEVCFGERRGEDAASGLLALEKGFYDLRISPVLAKPGKTIDITSLLLEAHRRMDEKQAGIA